VLALALPLVLPLVARLASEAGLLATTAASAALTVPVAVAVPVAVVVGVLVGVSVTLAVTFPDGDGEVNSDADAEAVLGPLLAEADGWSVGGVVATAERLADGLLELGEGDGEGDRDGDGDGSGDGDGVGVGVAEAGSAWHAVSVLDGVARGAACALSSTPRVRKLALSAMAAATLTCAKRMRNRLSTLLVRVTVCSSWFGGD
jgi:hypothetical protein